MALDNELLVSENIIHQAALVSYKSEIQFLQYVHCSVTRPLLVWLEVVNALIHVLTWYLSLKAMGVLVLVLQASSIKLVTIFTISPPSLLLSCTSTTYKELSPHPVALECSALASHRSPSRAAQPLMSRPGCWLVLAARILLKSRFYLLN